MDRFVNPAATAFRESLAGPALFVQVTIQSVPGGFELRHAADAGEDGTALRLLALDELPAWADTTEAGAFRPNKAAPHLRRGWRCRVNPDPELEWALEALYPGALADWFAVRNPATHVTSFREFVARQSGMYRDTQRLTDLQAAQIARAGCHSRFCLRRRCWTVPGLEPEAAESKSVVPCLEPCALLLEFARRTGRLAQDESVLVPLGPGQLDSLQAALARALDQPSTAVREGDSGHPDNPRRLQLLLDQLEALSRPGSPVKEA